MLFKEKFNLVSPVSLGLLTVPKDGPHTSSRTFYVFKAALRRGLYTEYSSKETDTF